MTHTYKITGMTCSGCQFKVQNLLSQVDGVKEVAVDVAGGEARIEMDKHLSIGSLKDALTNYPKYQIAEKGVIMPAQSIIPEEEEEEETKSWFATYRPLLLIVAYIFFVSLVTSFTDSSLNTGAWMNSFMAGFFIVFSFFKLLNLSDFAASYAMYDIIAKKVKGYGFVYPFIELALGIAYLIHFDPMFTGIATIVVMGISSIGVIQSVLNKQKIKCACLGAVFNLPMSTVTIIEDLLMVLMAIMLLAVAH